MGTRSFHDHISVSVSEKKHTEASNGTKMQFRSREHSRLLLAFWPKRRWPVCPWALHAYARSMERIRKESSACCFAQECHLRFASRFISTHWRRQDEADFWLLALSLFYFLAMPKLLSIARFERKQSAISLFEFLQGSVQQQTERLRWSTSKTRYGRC